MEENKFITLLVKHWSKLLLGILALATLLVWSQRLSNSRNQDQKQDFLIANQIFEQFQRGEYLSIESIESVQKILERHPELHAKYDLVLALTLFSQQKGVDALPYARSLVKQTEGQTPSHYHSFAETTFLISEEKYSEALAAALQLEREIAGQPETPILEGMNTLRIFFLADQMGNPTEKKRAWDKFVKLPSYPTITALFHEGDLSLQELIRE